MDMSKYKSMFVNEAREHLGQMDVAAAQLRSSPASRELIDQLFRQAHSIKGMAAAMEYTEISELAHGVEDMLSEFREGAKEPGPDVLGLLVEAIDALSVQVDARTGEGAPKESPALLEKIRGLTGGAPAAAPLPKKAAPELPKPAPKASSPASAGSLFEIRFSLSVTGTMAGLRGFLVYKRLGSAGPIESVDPDLPQLKGGSFRGPVRVRMRGAISREEVAKILDGVTEVSSWEMAEVREAPPSPPAADGSSPAAATSSAVARRETVSGTDSTVRVRTSLLDSFINAVGEMTVLRARLSRIAQERGDEELAEVSERLDVEVRNLYSRVMGVRLMPLDSVTSILPRMVRDVARRRGREVSFEVHGQDLEVDRSVLEVLLDPLIHILRNSVDHGIEPPEERVAAGKPREGSIRLLAYREREKTVIQISDDGRGLDPERLRMKAIDQGILTADAVSKMSDQEALQIICLPGFSTASEVTDTSGRGVGMNAVKNVLDRIGGILEIDSIPGKGTTFQLFLPRSVAIVPVLLVSAAGEVFGFPLSRVTRTLSVDPTELHVSRGRRFCLVEGETIPVVNLAEVFGVPRREKRAGGNGEELLVLVEREGGEIAVQVDAFAGHEEAFVKPLGKPMDRIPCLGGVFISGSGRPIFVVETGGLLPAGAGRSRGNPAYPAGMRS